MNAHFMEMAMKKAGKSFCYIKVSAVGFDKNGKFLACAVNSTRFERLGGGVHAEIALMRKAGPKLKSIMLCRVGRSGKLRPIDPCPHCRKVLDKKKIKVYSLTAADME